MEKIFKLELNHGHRTLHMPSKKNLNITAPIQKQTQTTLLDFIGYIKLLSCQVGNGRGNMHYVYDQLAFLIIRLF